MVEYESLPFDIDEDDLGNVVATCEVFPSLIGFGMDAEEASEDLADEIEHHVRRSALH